MRMGLLATLSIGIGWIIGVMVSMIFMPIGGTLNYDFLEAMGNTFVFGFPGFVMFMIALILSLREDTGDDDY